MEQSPRTWAEVLADEQARLYRAVARAQAGLHHAQARIRVEFDARTDDGLVPVRVGGADREVRVGEHVVAYEPGRAVQAPAVVERADGEWLALRVDRDAMGPAVGPGTIG